MITSARKPVDANEETLHWLRCIELAQTVYKPGFRVRGCVWAEDIPHDALRDQAIAPKNALNFLNDVEGYVLKQSDSRTEV